MSDTTARYLVAWGGDARSKDALALGVTLTKTFEAQLGIVYVVREETFGAHTVGDVSYTEEVVRQARSGIAKELAKYDGLDDVVVHVRRSESIAQGVLSVVVETGATLIVMGAGSGALALTANPVASALLHASPVPVAMAPQGYRKSAPEHLSELVAAVGPRPGAHRILDETVRGVERVRLPLRLLRHHHRHGRAERHGNLGQRSRRRTARRRNRRAVALLRSPLQHRWAPDRTHPQQVPGRPLRPAHRPRRHDARRIIRPHHES